MNRNLIIAMFAISLIFTSLVSPIYLMIKYDGLKETVLGKTTTSGTITLTVVNASETNETGEEEQQSPVPSGGGGSGGGSEPVIHEIDFSTAVNYQDIRVYEDDEIIIVLPGNNKYSFMVTKFLLNNQIELTYLNQKYVIEVDEIAYFDMDANNVNDFSIEFDGIYLEFILMTAEPIQNKSIIIPGFGKDKIIKPLGIDGLRTSYDLLIALTLIVLLVSSIFIYYHFRLSKFEKKNKMYVGKLHKNSKEDIKKLEKQKALLRKSYANKYISKSSYDKSIKRINQTIKRYRR